VDGPVEEVLEKTPKGTTVRRLDDLRLARRWEDPPGGDGSVKG
jgi:hypothetical protein